VNVIPLRNTVYLIRGARDHVNMHVSQMAIIRILTENSHDKWGDLKQIDKPIVDSKRVPMIVSSLKTLIFDNKER
jgi:hypothetical protein